MSYYLMVIYYQGHHLLVFIVETQNISSFDIDTKTYAELSYSSIASTFTRMPCFYGKFKTSYSSRILSRTHCGTSWMLP